MATQKRKKENNVVQKNVAKRNIHIGFSHPDTFLWTIVGYAIRETSAQLGIQLTISNVLTVGEQVAGIAGLIKQKIDILIISPLVSNDPNLILAIQKTNAQDIPIIVVGSEIGGSTSTCLIGPDNFKGQLLIMDYLFKHLGKKGKIAHIQGHSQLHDHTLRSQAVHSSLEKNPNIQLVFEKQCISKYTPEETGQKLAQEILTKHPDVNAIVTATDQIALGVIATIEEAGLTGKISVTGFDGIPQALQTIKSGKLLATISQSACEIAENAVAAALKAVEDKNTPKRIVTNLELITCDNVTDAAFETIDYVPSILNHVAESNTIQRQQEIITSQYKILQTTAAISRAAQNIPDSNQMTQEIVSLIRQHFGFNYVGLFLLDENDQILLSAKNGEASPAYEKKVALNATSTIGWCILNNKVRMEINDTELILPLSIGEKVIGVLALQQNNQNTFKAAHVMILQAMADQTAVALQNARLYAEQKSTLIFLDSIIDNIPATLYVKDAADLKYLRYNEAGEKLYGVKREEVIGKTAYDRFSKETADMITKIDQEVLAKGKLIDIPEEIIYTKNQSKRILHTRKLPILGPDGTSKFLLGISEDITKRKESEEALRESEERFRNLTELSSDWYWEQDENYRFTGVSGGHTSSPLNCNNDMGKTRWELPFIDVSEKKWEQHKKMLTERKPFYDLELARRLSDGSVRHVSISGRPIFDKDNNFKGYRGVGKDITERKLAEERIQYLAYHDGLTSLPNRSLFIQQVNHALVQAKRYKKGLAILFIDLDRFKNINDALGHEAGDDLLKQIAKRLRDCLREGDMVARLGGDEFVVLIEEMNESKYISNVARKILANIVQPISINGNELQITASIGISVYPEDGKDEQTLTKNADVAMYLAKEQGKNNYQFYSAQINAHSFERLALESNLRRALKNQEFLVYYQPKIDLNTSQVTGMEALIRWQHPDLGLIAPAQFIPLAEETGLIVPMGKLVLRTACEQNIAWQKQGFPKLHIAVNLSPRQFSDEHLINDVSNILDETGMDPALLELEITESMVMYNTKKTLEILRALKKMGIRIAIDDFGTGYSSLALLKQFPIDTIKIDRSFIRDIPNDQEDAAITDAIIAMGRALNLQIIAEGVEKKGQLNFLRDHDCDEMQGFYFSKPIPSEEFVVLLNKQFPKKQKSSIVPIKSRQKR